MEENFQIFGENFVEISLEQPKARNWKCSSPYVDMRESFVQLIVESIEVLIIGIEEIELETEKFRVNLIVHLYNGF